MSNTVLIKSYNKGISIHLDPLADIEIIKEDLAKTFKDAANFYRDAKIVVSFEDRELDSQTERDLVNVITANCQVNIIAIAGKNKLVQQMITNALNQIEYKNEVANNAIQVYKGSLKDNQVLDVPGSILILGDVNPGCSVIASGDIYIYGALYGQAHAGSSGDENHVIAALEMNPVKLRIAGIKYKPDEKPKWSIKSKQTVTPKAARLDLSTYSIVMESVSKQFWNAFFEEGK